MQEIKSYVEWFKKDSPNFELLFGDIMDFYSHEENSFHIQEIQDSFEFFIKTGFSYTLFYYWQY